MISLISYLLSRNLLSKNLKRMVWNGMERYGTVLYPRAVNKEPFLRLS